MFLPAVVSFVLVAAGASAQETPQTLYEGTHAREQSVRSVLAAEEAPASVLRDVRAVVAAYESLVRQNPTSGYCDNALWQAGRLSLDAYVRFGEPREKAAGVRLLNMLAAQYPASRYVKQVPEQLAPFDLATALPAPAVPAAAAPVTAAPLPSVATITAIRRDVLPDVVRVTIELDAEVAFHEERLSDPPRVFLDLPRTRAMPPLQDQTLRFDGDGDVVRQVRVGRHPNRTTRVVLDGAGVSSYSVYPLYNPFRLVIDCVRTASPVAPVVAAVQPMPGALSPGPPAPPVAPAVKLPAIVPPQPPPAGGVSIARQLGLKVSRIVIDPGHGGHDSGARGKGVSEAEVVLDVALRVEKLLKAVDGVEVILTRRTDEFVPLEERTAMANREGADLFLSIHANASRRTEARGVETYFLNFATTLGAEAVAERENAASGHTMSALPDFVKAIALNNKLDESRALAAEVQSAMVARLRRSNAAVKDLGVKQAPFVVLIGAAMPSVLAEISFVTNPQEARLLKSGSYRQRIAEALFNAIAKYQRSLKKGS